MMIKLGSRYRLSLMRIPQIQSYKPDLIESGQLPQPLCVQYFTYRRDRYFSDEPEQLQQILDKLRAEGLYKPGLVFAGIRGVDIYKRGTFGKRDRTFAVTETGFRRAVSERWRDYKYFLNPFMYMDAEGKSMPCLVVLDGSKLVGGDEYDMPQPAKRDIRRIYWWTPDGSSLDTVVVAVFFFQPYDSFKD